MAGVLSARRVEIRSAPVRGILSATSGFIAEAGFSHSLTPARNCTFACTYCYVPTMGVYGGLQPEDWQRWGQFTTFKENAAELLAQKSHKGQRIYCSPLVDPYQPAEEESPHMPAILDALIARPPEVFVFQTRGPLILRDLEQIRELARVCTVRVSFSIPTNRNEVLRRFEPHCPSLEDRIETLRELREAGIETYATLAPLLPCDPEELASIAIGATGRDLIGDPLHVRAVKRSGATTPEAAFRICRKRGYDEWVEPGFQEQVVARIQARAGELGRSFTVGSEGFSLLARCG